MTKQQELVSGGDRRARWQAGPCGRRFLLFLGTSMYFSAFQRLMLYISTIIMTRRLL